MSDASQPSNGERSGVNLPLWLVATIVGVAVIVTASASALLLGGGGADTATTSDSEAVPETTSSTTVEPTTSTSTSTSTTSTTIDPLHDMEAARASWEEQPAGEMRDLVAGPVMVDEVPHMVTATSVAIGSWTWDGEHWSFEADVPLTNPAIDVLAIELVDVTDNGNPELLVQYVPGNAATAEAFVRGVTGWQRVPIELTLVGSTADSNPSSLDVADGQLLALHKLCEPSCSHGNLLHVALEYDGQRFVGRESWCFEWRDRPRGSALAMCDRGPDVEELQEILAWYGYLEAPVDGQFGQATRDALRRHQADRERMVTGGLSAFDYEMIWLDYQWDRYGVAYH